MAKGRPKGSPNVEHVADAIPSQCPECGSTRRTEYEGSRVVQEFAGELDDGTRYNRIVRRRCRCDDCGQVRIDRTFEYEPDDC